MHNKNQPEPQPPVFGGTSTLGNPRRVTDAQVAAILAWHAEYLVRKQNLRELGTLRELVRDLQTTKGTASKVIRIKGAFKQPSPERRAEVQRAMQARLAELRGTWRAPRAARRRVTILSEAQLAKVRKWAAARQAVVDANRALPTAVAVERHLRIPRQTLPRILARITRVPPTPAAFGNSRRVRRFGRVDTQSLLAWKSIRDRREQQEARVPSPEAFAARLGVTIGRLVQSLRYLDLPIPRRSKSHLRW